MTNQKQTTYLKIHQSRKHLERYSKDFLDLTHQAKKQTQLFQSKHILQFQPIEIFDNVQREKYAKLSDPNLRKSDVNVRCCDKCNQHD